MDRVGIIPRFDADDTQKGGDKKPWNLTGWVLLPVYADGAKVPEGPLV